MLAWDELFATSETSGPMKKAYSALLAFDDQLLAFGGKGKTGPGSPSPLAKYEKSHDGWIYTNEHQLYDWERGKDRFLNAVTLICSLICVHNQE